MNNKYAFIVAALATICFMFAACAGHDTLQKNRGSAFESAKQNQTANPDAAKNLDPVVDLDGTAAKKAMDAYQQGCGDKKKDTTYNLRLGTIEGIGEKK